MINLSKFRWLILFVLFDLFLLFPVFKGLYPVPLDVLAGAHYPWLDYKWGYSVGVPVKNASLSDVISQLYVWRSFAMDQIRDGHFPLWNPYSYTGMPLMANIQSAVFYPFNLLMLVFGNIQGWTMLIYCQLLLSQIFMYLFLKSHKISYLPSLAGSVVFSLSGFMMTNLQYVTVGHTFLWVPLILLILNLFINGQTKYIKYLPFVIFLQITAGSIYGFFYSGLVTIAFIWFHRKRFQIKNIFSKLLLLAVLGFGLASVQIVPAIELLNRSIRQIDPNILEHQFGLLPIKYLISFIAPDFFGNPATNNFLGFLGYQETSGYFSIVALILLFSSFKWLTNSREKFWLLFAIVLLIFTFNNPLSRLIYNSRLPLISSWYASRLLLPINFILAIITATVIQNIHQVNKKHVVVLSTGIVSLSLVVGYFFQWNLVSVRNLIFPILLVLMLTTVWIVFKSSRIRSGFVLALIVFDLSRYYFKFTPFSPSILDYPDTPVISFLKSQGQNYRIDKEKGPLFPPNSLVAYSLSTPSGYDPMAPLDSVKFYDSYYNQQPDTKADSSPTISRYSELTSYLSPGIDLYGVKYLAVSKRDQSGQIRPWGEIRPDLKSEKFKGIFSDESTVVLENTTVLPRAILYTDYVVESDIEKVRQMLINGFDIRNRAILDSDVAGHLPVSGSLASADITKYLPDRVQITTQTSLFSVLVLTDSYFPGWQVFIDGKNAPLHKAFGIFRAVSVPPGKHLVEFRYMPTSFIYGISLTLISLASIVYFSRRLGIKSDTT